MKNKCIRKKRVISKKKKSSYLSSGCLDMWGEHKTYKSPNKKIRSNKGQIALYSTPRGRE